MNYMKLLISALFSLLIIAACENKSQDDSVKNDSVRIDTGGMRDTLEVHNLDSVRRDSIVKTPVEKTNDTGKTKKTQKDCINPATVNSDALCIEVYDPVCGCNNKTYSNECKARNAGVTRWKKGECK